MGRLLLFVGPGGLVGASLRCLASGHAQQLANSAAFAYGTLAVHVIGCFMIRPLSKLAEMHGLLTADARALVPPAFLAASRYPPLSVTRP